MLTDLRARTAQPKERPYKIRDSQGLFLYITPTGRKYWRFAYKYNGKWKLLSLGPYPAVSLEEARRKRDEMRLQLLEGYDPSWVRKQRRLEKEVMFEEVARAWLEHVQKNWTKGHYEKQALRVEKHILPHLGRIPVKAITAGEVLKLVEKTTSRGTPETARRIFTIVNQIFKFAQMWSYFPINKDIKIELSRGV